jgi:hypothetical protein
VLQRAADRRLTNHTPTTVEGELGPGCAIRIHGLLRVPALNGKVGRVDSYDAERGRWVATILGTDMQVRLMPACASLLGGAAVGSSVMVGGRCDDGPRPRPQVNGALSSSGGACPGAPTSWPPNASGAAEHAASAGLAQTLYGGGCADNIAPSPTPDSAGGGVRIRSRNIRKLHLHVDEMVADTSFDIAMLQEADTPEYDVGRVEAKLRAGGIATVWGDPTQLSHGNSGRRVAILSRLAAKPVEPTRLVDANLAWLRATGRYVEALLMLAPTVGRSTVRHATASPAPPLPTARRAGTMRPSSLPLLCARRSSNEYPPTLGTI